MEVASSESLVLIDEIGNGTDPLEGVALSTSILRYLADRVNLAVVTTHYADLSSLKAKDARFENAAMEFCIETLQPTYQVLWGSAGTSNALSIAKSIGFDQRLLDRAYEWVQKLMPDKQKERKGLLYQSLHEERETLKAQAEKAASVLSEIKKLYHEVCFYCVCEKKKKKIEMLLYYFMIGSVVDFKCSSLTPCSFVADTNSRMQNHNIFIFNGHNLNTEMACHGCKWLKVLIEHLKNSQLTLHKSIGLD